MNKPFVRIVLAIVLLAQIVTFTPMATPVGRAAPAPLNETGGHCTTTTPIPAPRTFHIIPGQSQRLVHDEAVLDIGAGAVGVTTDISITPLRHDGIPTPDIEMTNVTKGGRCGYRFTPHPMRFNNPIEVTLPYNKALLPPGSKEEDIKTFYFDDQAGYWKELERVTVDTQRKVVVSRTDHFTDMINATITVPDHPSTLSLNPTSIKDIKAADPGAGVNLIAPPEASNMGDAQLSYPIEVPPGRGGMQPQLGISYNSSGSNGWLGVGWDLSMQAVTIDTRWGVPRYDLADETETYSLSGDQLTPVFHRGPLQPRTSPRTFHARVEGSFQKIVRLGDSPANYRWEVTDKAGTRYFFGTGANSRLSDGAGRTFMWALQEVRDLHGNNMLYQYDQVTGGGGASGEPWHQIYLRSIRYTGSASGPGPYEVLFNRESRSPQNDLIVDGRPGFKTVVDRRLASIEVRLLSEPNPLIRKYVLEYETGQFEKTRLASVTQYGQDGVTEFNSHSFEYYDEVATGTAREISGFENDGDGLSGATGAQGSGLLRRFGNDPRSPAFGGDQTASNQVHFYGGIAQGPLKEVSAGFKVGSETSNTKTELTLIDMNGDGLADQVYKQGGQVVYRRNLGGPQSEPAFATTPVVVTGLLQLGEENGNTFTLGPEGFALGINGLGDASWTRTKGQSYLADINGDMLPDLVANSRVFFNRLNSEGNPTFALGNSSPTPLETGANSDTTGMIEPISPTLQLTMSKYFHLVDPVRRWKAPYNGNVEISGTVRLLTGPTEGYETADGITVTVEHDGSILWSRSITDPQDLATRVITGLNSIAVNKGDDIYFRVNSRNDGSFDATEFTSTIKYIGMAATATDVNNKRIFLFNSESDFSFGSRTLTVTLPLTLPYTAHLAGTVTKSAATTDNIFVEVIRNNVLVNSLTIPAAQTGTFPVSLPFSRAVGGSQEALVVRFGADTPVDLSVVEFVPRVVYDSINGQPAPIDPDGNPSFVVTPTLSAQIYPGVLGPDPYTPWEVPNDIVAITVTQEVVVSDTLPLDHQTYIGLAVKRQGALLAKQRVDVRNGGILGTDTLFARIPVSEGQKIYFHSAANNGQTLDMINQGHLLIEPPEVQMQTITGAVLLALNVPTATYFGVPDTEAFGGGDRNWYYGQYNGPDPAAPIDESLLVLPDDNTPDDEVGEKFIQMLPFAETGRWRIDDEECFIVPNGASASRLNLNYLDFSDGAGFGGGRGVTRHSGGFNAAGQISVLVFGAGASAGRNWSDIDFLDFNGDQYPDVIGRGEVQRTLPNGALEAGRINVDRPDIVFDNVRNSTNRSLNVSLGATTSRQITNAQNQTQGATTEQAPYNLHANFGGSVTGNTGDVTTQWDLLDINGDSLPDYVHKAASGLDVHLNLGDRFGALERWLSPGSPMQGQMRFEQSMSVALGTSAGLSAVAGGTAPAYSFGGGFGQTKSTAGAERDLMDVNGDGLLDLVTKPISLVTTDGTFNSSDNYLTVSFNTGYGFTQPYEVQGTLRKPLRANETISRNLGAHFTISIWIPFTDKFIVLNPGYYRNESLGGPSVQLNDLNGDSYPDHISSDTEGNVRFNLNKHGRTNLLKTVHRPLGGRFDLDYERSGNTTDQPGNRWVLSKVSMFDGVQGDGDASVRGDQGRSTKDEGRRTKGIKPAAPAITPVTMLTTYSYAAGKYDRAEREFYGYETVTVTHRLPAEGDAPYRHVVRTFLNNSFYDRGLITREVTLDTNGHKFNETINQYAVTTVAGGLPGLEEFTATRFPHLTRSDQRFYEGNPAPGKSTFTTYQYDALGNVTRFLDAGDVGTADDVLADVTYSAEDAACLSTYVVGEPKTISVTSNGTELRRREATVNCATGNVTQVREYLADGTFAQTDLAYFPNGNLRHVIAPPNLRGDHYTVEYRYDDVVDTHIIEIEDSFEYLSSTAYDFKFGLPERTTDINNNVTTYEYDQFGRPFTIKGPYEQGGTRPTIQFEYHHDVSAPSVPWALTRHFDGFRSQTDTLDTVIFIDGLKRVLQTKKDASVFRGRDAAPQDVTIVSGRVTFDDLGRTVEQFFPITETLGTPGTFNPAYDDSADPTTMEFDILDRTTSITMPDNTTTTSAYSFGPDRSSTTQFETTVTDANSLQKKTYHDVRQLLTGVKEFHRPPGQPTQVLWTSYAYDPMDQLVEIKDTARNTTSFTYDNLGRRISIDNPDTGLIEVGYDLAGNVISKQTANLREQSKQIEYDYEFNRLVRVTYPNFPETDVRYTYGDPGAAYNRAGRIILVQDESGSEERFYGKLGEPVKEIKTIASDTGDPETYTTQYVYDTFGRLQRLTYPDGEVLTYSYDSGGQVRSVQGRRGLFLYNYINRLEYDRFEQQAFLKSGNNVITEYTYRPDNRRLQNLRAGLGNGNAFQNLNYSYDSVGNVLSLQNTVPVPPPSQYGGPTIQTYTYDDLYRLTNAVGSYQFAPDKTRQYRMAMTYDNLHNIVTKDQRDDIVQPSGQTVPQLKTTYTFDYDYSGPQPHAPTHIDDRTYSYDANGNQTGWEHDSNGQERTIVWDDENRIQEVFDNGHSKTYKYDDAGERVIKRGPQGETAYVNAFFTTRDREVVTKHVFVGNTRLVSKMGAHSDRTQERQLYFFHPDHLGSSNYITDLTGQLYEHLEYFPFGEAWVEENSNTQRTPYAFTGKELDEETGLQYNSMRYYDPRTSVWQSTDPLLPQNPGQVVGDSKILNAYAYAATNPVMYNDPDGRQPKPAEKRPTIEIDDDAFDLTAKMHDFLLGSPEAQKQLSAMKAKAAAPKSRSPEGMRDITAEEAQPLVEAAKTLQKEKVPYAFNGRKSHLQGADCTGALGMIYEMAGLPYGGVGSTYGVGDPKSEPDFHKKFRQVDPKKEALQAGDVIRWHGHVSMYDPKAGVGKDLWNAFYPGGPTFGTSNKDNLDKWFAGEAVKHPNDPKKKYVDYTVWRRQVPVK